MISSFKSKSWMLHIKLWIPTLKKKSSIDLPHSRFVFFPNDLDFKLCITYKYFRSKDSMSMSEMSRNSHPHPYVLSQMQPYYGPNHHRNSQNNPNSQYPVSQSEWDDTHFRWPSPSLPPTLKKGQNKHHFGTLDKGKYNDLQSRCWL